MSEFRACFELSKYFMIIEIYNSDINITFDNNMRLKKRQLP